MIVENVQITQSPTVAGERILARMSNSVYKKFASQAVGRLSLVPANDGEAHFRCGVEYVLRMLREGIVIESGE